MVILLFGNFVLIKIKRIYFYNNHIFFEYSIIFIMKCIFCEKIKENNDAIYQVYYTYFKIKG